MSQGIKAVASVSPTLGETKERAAMAARHWRYCDYRVAGVVVTGKDEGERRGRLVSVAIGLISALPLASDVSQLSLVVYPPSRTLFSTLCVCLDVALVSVAWGTFLGAAHDIWHGRLAVWVVWRLWR